MYKKIETKHWNGISIHDPQSTRLVKQSANEISWKLVPCSLHILKHTLILLSSNNPHQAYETKFQIFNKCSPIQFLQPNNRSFTL